MSPLRTTIAVALGSAWLTSRVSHFHERYPDITVSIALADSPELSLIDDDPISACSQVGSTPT